MPGHQALPAGQQRGALRRRFAALPTRPAPLLRLVTLLPAAACAVLPCWNAAASGNPTELCRTAIAQAEREAALPPRLLAAIGRVESGRRDPGTGTVGPWPWTINAEGRGSFFPDRAAAIAAVRTLQGQGVRSIDIGCMQINLRHHPHAFGSLEAAFDPLTNARYAARFLSELHAGRGDWMRAAAHYHSQTPEFAEPYRHRVAAAWEAERNGPPPALSSSAGFGPGAARLGNGATRPGATTLAGGPSGGRGLDAYRAHPIMLVGRVSPDRGPLAATPRLVRHEGPAAAAPATFAASPGRATPLPPPLPPTHRATHQTPPPAPGRPALPAGSAAGRSAAVLSPQDGTRAGQVGIASPPATASAGRSALLAGPVAPAQRMQTPPLPGAGRRSLDLFTDTKPLRTVAPAPVPPRRS
jgi:hypothetical protein